MVDIHIRTSGRNKMYSSTSGLGVDPLEPEMSEVGVQLNGLDSWAARARAKISAFGTMAMVLGQAGSGVSQSSSNRRRRRVSQQLTHLDALRVVLFCSAGQPADFDARRPRRVQMLPEEVGVPEPSPKHPKRSNGCGRKVHASATPKPGLWLGAQSDGIAAVVSLEQQRRFVVASEVLLGVLFGSLTVCCDNHPNTLSESSPTAALYKFVPSAVSPPLPVVPARRPPLSAAAYPTSRLPIDFDSDSGDANLWVRPPRRAILDALNAAETAARENALVDANACMPAPAAMDANAFHAATTRVHRVGLTSHLGQRFQ
ncbi:hypothetical protein B0H13DRAFT_1924894 [Mycena leptocephala]|nr:hypothetical protein B0H13DRAFT_1924894 [Mycena leptocephala]